MRFAKQLEQIEPVLTWYDCLPQYRFFRQHPFSMYTKLLTTSSPPVCNCTPLPIPQLYVLIVITLPFIDLLIFCLFLHAICLPIFQ